MCEYTKNIIHKKYLTCALFTAYETSEISNIFWPFALVDVLHFKTYEITKKDKRRH